MAHNITSTDNAVFAGNEPAWHKLGVVLPDKLLTTEQIIAHCLNWEVYQEPVVTSKGITLPGQFINIRSDNDQPLGVVGERYDIFQNSDAFRFMDDLMADPNGPKYVTAGSLFGGKKIWLLAKFPEGFHVGPEDQIDNYLFLASGHDGATARTIQWTPTRVVCWNTFSAALAQNDSTTRRFQFKHFKSNNTLEARECLGIVFDNMEKMKDVFTKLTAVDVTDSEVTEVLSALWPNQRTVASSSEEALKLKSPVLQVRRLLTEGMGADMEHCKGTAYGLYQGITEYIDHYARYKNDETKMVSVLAGKGSDKKAEALDLLVSKYVD